MDMKLVVACVTALGLTGCLWANKNSDSMTGFETHAMLGTSGLEGVDLQAVGGYAGLYIAGDATVRGADRPADPSAYRAATFGLSLRGSLFGIVGNEHRL